MKIDFRLTALLLGCLLLTGCAAGPKAVPGTDGPGEGELRISHDSGIYPGEVMKVSLEAGGPYTIAWTADGTCPTAEDDSGKAELSLELSPGPGYLSEHRSQMLCPDLPEMRIRSSEDLPAGIVLRAALADRNGQISEPVTRVYFPGLDPEERFPGCALVSVTADPEDLLGYDRGILAAGASYDAWKDLPEAAEIRREQLWWKVQTNSTQRGKSWERQCLLQIFEPGTREAAVLPAGIRVRGNVSRAEGQKSFNLYFRKDYGLSRPKLEVFGTPETCDSLVLRGGGNETSGLKYKDSLLQQLAPDRSMLILKNRPAVLFLNGEYWGVYSLSEKLTDVTVAGRYGVDPAQVVIMKEGEVEEGREEDRLLYEDLMEFAGQDLRDPENYARFCETMDVRSMIDYFAVRIYIGDADWDPGKNDVLWRTRDASYLDGRWQYVLYDTEYSAGKYGTEETSVRTDHYRRALEHFPLFAAAMENPEFAGMFLETLQEMSERFYAPERVEKMTAEYEEQWLPLMPDHYLRFSDTSDAWNSSLISLREFFRDRSTYLIPAAEQEIHSLHPERQGNDS